MEAKNLLYTIVTQKKKFVIKTNDRRKSFTSIFRYKFRLLIAVLKVEYFLNNYSQ